MLSSCIPFTISRKNLSIIILYLNRNNYVVKNLFIVYLSFLGEWPRHEAL